MSDPLAWLALTAASLGVLHTLLGPDHYLPFVMMGRAGRWSRAKTVVVTLACGLGHVLSSVVLGVVGIALGVAVGRLEAVESFCGQVAAWALIAFGLVYFVWGLRRAARQRTHAHVHAHADGTIHIHAHVHEHEHLHVHAAEPHLPAQTMGKPMLFGGAGFQPGRKHASENRALAPEGSLGQALTPWVLFTIFVFGPCEPLIPLLLYPAAHQSPGRVIVVAVVFGVATLATMVAAVLACQLGVERLPLGKLEPYTHALAGAALALCGAAIEFLGV